MSKEIMLPLAGGRIEIHVQRHDTHEQGHLTPEGRNHAKEVAVRKIKDYLDRDPNTNFLIIASDQVFDDDVPDLGGKRAKETAEIITEEIRGELERRQIPADHLFGFDEMPIAVSPTLREAGIFSQGFMKVLKEKYPDVKFKDIWKIYYQDIESQTREELHAEDPKDLARRMDYMIKTAELAGASFYRTPGKEGQPLVIWIVGHGGGIDSYLHQYADVPLDKVGFDVSEGFSIRAKADGQVVAEVKGGEYLLHQDDSFELPSKL